MITDTLSSFFVIAALGAILKQFKVKTLWFIMHAIVNAGVTITAFSDLLTLLLDPLSKNISNETLPTTMVMALHLYHMIFMTDEVKTIDWIHHIVMCAALSSVYFYPETLMVANSTLFFASGLPGGIDYVMMSLVKNGKFSSLEEKHINSHLNTWIRSVGLLFCAFCIYIKIVTGQYPLSFVSIFVIISLIWNAQYFSREVNISYGRNT